MIPGEEKEQSSKIAAEKRPAESRAGRASIRKASSSGSSPTVRSIRGTHAPIGYAHLTTIAEFHDLPTAGFEEVVALGTESFTPAWQDEWKAKSAADMAG